MDAVDDAGAVPRAWRWLDLTLAIAAAAVIVWGVLAGGWSVFFVMALFWLENLITGIFNLARMLVTGARGAGLTAALATGAFFCVHYGLFTAVHGMFVVVLFGASELGRDAASGGLFEPLARMTELLLADADGRWAVAAMIALHAGSFAQWCFEPRAAHLPLARQMSAPYGRIMVLHIALLAGGFLAQWSGLPVAGALMLTGLKLAYDLVTLARAARPAPILRGSTHG